MKLVRHAMAMGSWLLVFALAGCGGGGGDSAPTPAGTDIGAAGGTVNGPLGAQVVVPAGALANDTAVGVAQTSLGAPVMPLGVATVGPMFAFTPHGTQFAAAVTISVPFDPASVPPGATPLLFKTNAGQTAWERVPGSVVSGSSISGQVTGFSYVGAVVLAYDDEYQFTDATFAGLESGEPKTSKNVDVNVAYNVGTIDLRPVGTDPESGAFVHVGNDGSVYWVSAVAPYVDFADPGSPLGHWGTLTHTQQFKKTDAAAKLQLVITQMSTETIDSHGQKPTARECPQLNTPGNTIADCTDQLFAKLSFQIDAYADIGSGRTLSLARGLLSAGIGGYIGNWGHSAGDLDPESTLKYAAAPSFRFDGDADDFLGTHARQVLTQPILVDIPLDTVGVNQTFIVKVVALAQAENRRGGDAFAGAWFHDPLKVSGVGYQGTGIVPIVSLTPLPTPPARVSEPAPACPTGSDPAAGTLQFDVAEFRVREGGLGGTATIAVTRSGGSKGEVTALFGTRAGTARAGTDYDNVSTLVRFGDGQQGTKNVEIPAHDNLEVNDNRTVLLSLSDARGCAVLGSPASATLTLLDDDHPLPAPPPSGLDTSFGNAGKVTTPFGGVDTAMALQSDGKIVMVGGSINDFLLARYNADGSLDAGFGANGLVTTDIGGFPQEEARAVAIQPDGKILVVGNSRVSGAGAFNFTLARYNADGSLDASFGQAGKGVSSVIGRGFAVALQSGGKIIVAGDDTATFDFKLARFNADGSLDTSFGNAGSVTTDIAGGFDVARNLVLQPNGAIVASGAFSNSTETGVVRYLSDGTLDTSFGALGKVVLAGALVGEGLALQADGKLVLVGSKQVGQNGANVTQFEMRRLNADGSVDLAFGSGGTVDTAFTTSLDSAQAVALQADGKILVSGQGGLIRFGLARYNADGTLDAGFATGGKLKVDFFGFASSAESVAVQPDGKIVLGGFAGNTVRLGYALARVNP